MGSTTTFRWNDGREMTALGKASAGNDAQGAETTSAGSGPKSEAGTRADTRSTARRYGAV